MKTSDKKLAYIREYRAKNRERLRAWKREYYYSHHEEQLAYQKAYRERRKAEMTDEERAERREYFRVMGRIYRKIRRDREYARQENRKACKADVL